MSVELALAFAFGVVFVGLLFAVGCVMAFRGNAAPIPEDAMFIFRVVLSLAAAGIGAILPGFLNIEGQLANFTVRSGGALALFLLVYRINPPTLLPRRIPTPRKPVRRPVNRDHGR